MSEEEPLCLLDLVRNRNLAGRDWTGVVCVQTPICRSPSLIEIINLASGIELNAD